ncbi:MAG: RepB family plasmid replication initiator protein [Bacteroidota bacterium]
MPTPSASVQPEVLPARRGELKKHVGAVHVKGQLSLLQRKVSNVLLLRAYEDLPNPEVFEHEIRLQTLAEVAGFDSNDHALLREALEALAGTTITWNLLDAEGAEEWGVSTFLAQAVVKNGTCRYAPDLRRKLYNPEIYARINLSVQERFGSGYALALYENCVRFRKVGSTGWIDLDRWRDLLGVEPGQYDQFKYLNRDVLKPAVEEVNRYSDIRVEMDRKREKRRVVALKFSIQENDQLALDLAGSASRAAAQASAVGEFPRELPDPRALAPDADALLGPLQRRLVSFGLSQAQALDLSTEFDPDRVSRNLDHVEREIARRKDTARPVDRVAAFTIDAVRNDYAATSGTPAVVQEAEQKQARAKQAQAEKRRQREERKAQAAQAERERGEARDRALDEAFAALPEAERDALTARAVARLASEAPQVHAWYQDELAAGVAEDAMRPAVLSTLRAFRRDLIPGRPRSDA